MPFDLRYPALLGLVAVLSGCHHNAAADRPLVDHLAHHRNRDLESDTAPAVESYVDVSGAVREPKSIPLADGMTLSQAVTRAGGSILPPKDQLSSAIGPLVALQRGHGLQLETYYFPESEVVGGVAGEIALMPGDYIRIVESTKTSLEQPVTATSDSPTFMWEGLVQRPGVRKISGSLKTLNQLAAAGTDTNLLIDKNQPLPSVMLLTRTSPSGIGTDRYFLPLAIAQESTNASIAEGDAFLLTRPELIPIVTESLIRPVVQSRVREADQKLRSAFARRQLQQDLKRRQSPAPFWSAIDIRSRLP